MNKTTLRVFILGLGSDPWDLVLWSSSLQQGFAGAWSRERREVTQRPEKSKATVPLGLAKKEIQVFGSQ